MCVSRRYHTRENTQTWVYIKSCKCRLPLCKRLVSPTSFVGSPISGMGTLFQLTLRLNGVHDSTMTSVVWTPKARSEGRRWLTRLRTHVLQSNALVTIIRDDGYLRFQTKLERTADAEINFFMVGAERLSRGSLKPWVGQNIALRPVSADRTSTPLAPGYKTSAFPTI